MKIRSLGRYEVRGELGRGTMGIVYRGYDPVLDREIALKTIDLPDALSPERRKRFLDRFFLEAKIAGKLIHPNIVVTHDAAMDDETDIPFIAMERVAGASLHAHVREGAVEWRDALTLVEPLATALDYAHQQGVVHRDIKPANVLLTAKGVPKIADFGIAKLPNGELTQTGTVVGTPYFMSPEQLRGDDVDGRSDIFSLGALLYNLLTGIPPFRGSDIANIAQQVLYKSPKAPSELEAQLPPALDGVVARAMAKALEERYRSGEELAADLARVRNGEEPLRALSLGEKTQEAVRAAAGASPDDIEGAEGAEGVGVDGALELVPDSAPRPSRGWLLVVLLVVGAGGVVATRWSDVTRFVVEPIEQQLAEDARRAGVRSEAAERLTEVSELFDRRELALATAATERALELSRDANDGAGEAQSLLWRGRIRAERGDWSRARADFEAAGAVFEIYGVPGGNAESLVELGDLERDLGRFEVAESFYDAAEPSADTTLSRAWLALMRGALEDAERGFERSGAWAQAGAMAAARGDQTEADDRWRRAAPSRRLSQFRGNAALLAGDMETALRLFDDAGLDFPEPPYREDADGVESSESALRKMFRVSPKTPRREARYERLP